MNADADVETGVTLVSGTDDKIHTRKSDLACSTASTTLACSSASTTLEDPAYGELVSDSDATPRANTTSRIDGPKSRNIRRMMILTFSFALGCSVLFGAVFDMYVYELSGGKNAIVGLIESINGLVSLISAIPVAWCVDKLSSRAKIARNSAAFGVVSGVFFIVSISLDYIPLLIVALIFMGVFYELQISTTEAIFADSCEQGERSKLFVRKSMIALIASSIGPLFALVGIALLHFNDAWPKASIHIILISGAIALVPCLAICASFEDLPADTTGPSELTHLTNDENSEAPPISHGRSKYQKWVPYILSTVDFVTSIGAGMTVKFFTLFFINDQKFTAFEICLLQTAYPLVIAIFQYGIQRVSTSIGRAQASFMSFFCNIICFLVLWKIEQKALLIAVFLVRGGFANSVYPIDRSILMDYTPSSQRGRWNAVESFSSATWSGSAFLGGYLVDYDNYRAPFIVTAGLYAVGCIIYSPLLFLVPRKEQATSEARQPLVSSGE